VEFPVERKVSATKRKISVTGKRKRREAVKVTEDFSVFVSDDDLFSLVKGGLVKVHQHGSGKYLGQYLFLRRAGGRKDKRPVLASGRPEKLTEYLAGLGVHLCTSCRTVTLGGACSLCGRK
jgi:hypothetical protein